MDIKNLITGETIYTVPGDNLCGANLCGANLCGANLCGANLCGANLRGADLREANLYRADLRGANLYRADLREANLYRADLCGADLRGADLRGADLRDIRVSWYDHQLISEILFRAANGELQKEAFAGFVRIKTGWCWNNFLKMENTLKEWALDELGKWVKPDDGAPPAVYERRTYRKERKNVS